MLSKSALMAAIAGGVTTAMVIAMAAGIDFDTEAGHRFVRFSFAGPEADIEEGLARLSTAL